MFKILIKSILKGPVIFIEKLIHVFSGWTISAPGCTGSGFWIWSNLQFRVEPFLVQPWVSNTVKTPRGWTKTLKLGFILPKKWSKSPFILINWLKFKLESSLNTPHQDASKFSSHQMFAFYWILCHQDLYCHDLQPLWTHPVFKNFKLITPCCSDSNKHYLCFGSINTMRGWYYPPTNILMKLIVDNVFSRPIGR